MAAPISRLALSPVTTGSIWLALTAPQTRDQALAHLGKYLSQTSIDRTTTALKWLTILGLARWANRAFSDLAENNFRFSSEGHRYDWPNEIAVITGGTGGFGSLMSKALAKKGLTVICVDLRDELPAHMQSYPTIKYHRCDITDVAAVKQLAEDIRAQHGKDPSILINNAGIAYDHTILTASPDSLKKIFDVNLLAHYTLLQAFLPAMIQAKKGHVVSIASMASFISGAGLAPYAGTKAAVLALHEGLQQEVRVLHRAPEIKFTVVHPTFAQTPLIEPFEQQLKSDRARILRPEVVSEAVVRQILRCRGGQVVLGGDIGWLAGIRSWPQWLQQTLIRTTDGGHRRGQAAKEGKTGGSG
ncbi:hypothetical protein LTR53_008276 [Teratosphaeriaceae sp. CCFEE 6253]|nr:hypothetical protein LTR53_008276 [Teratosphaeriaceae sp. CCFEE 6253]